MLPGMDLNSFLAYFEPRCRISEFLPNDIQAIRKVGREFILCLMYFYHKS